MQAMTEKEVKYIIVPSDDPKEEGNMSLHINITDLETTSAELFTFL